MTPRQRERVKSYGCIAFVLAMWLVLTGWRWTVALVALCVLVWLGAVYVPHVVTIKRNRRIG